MEYSINEKTVEAVLTSVNLETKIDGGNLEVVIGDSAKMEVSEAVNYIKSGQAEVQETVDEGIRTFNQNATEKTGDFNANAINKTNAFNQNATDKTDAFNSNATSKTNDFNTNASAKTTAFDENAGSKISEYNSNATEKLSAYNTNAIDKTTAFNTNYTEKKALIDEQVGIATTQANLAKQYAIGDPTEPTEHSAKYWAEQAESELSGLSSRVTTIEGKIPSSASSSNQLTDKSYVDTQDNALQSQIDALVVASDVFDIVGTYAELQAYDISTVPVNDIIKVLVDSTHSNAATYYRCVESGGVKSWLYIGSEGAYYTKAETNSLLDDKQDTLVSGTNIKTLNNESLLGSGNININSATWGNITGTLSNQTDLDNALSAKYDASNPAGYTSNVGTVTSVNNTQPDANGNVTISTGGNYTAGTGIDITNDVISVTAPTLTNTATGSGNLVVGGSQPISTGNTSFGFYSSTSLEGTSFGYGATASGSEGVAIGWGSNATANHSTALGTKSTSSGMFAIQIGRGTNSTDYSLSIGFDSTGNYQLLDGTTGLIPDARISSNIARTSSIPTVDQTYDGASTNAQSGTAVAQALSSFSGANTDLSNLTSQGQNIANWSSNVTNCITEIPQDIKLKLSNGTLTLKAGSKVYIPNGFESNGTTPKFDEIVIANDLTFSYTGATTGRMLIAYDPLGSGLIYGRWDDGHCLSGTSTPTSNYYMYYNTTDNICYNVNNTTGRTSSFPICSVQVYDNNIQAIDQVFNGFGYIGSTVFALPGVKGLIPNGRNEDGSLKNIEVVVNSVKTYTITGWERLDLLLFENSINVWPSQYSRYTDENFYEVYDTSQSKWVKSSAAVFGFASFNGRITSFTPKTAFHALDYNDGSWVAQQAMPSSRYIDLNLGASGATYTAPANGYFCLDKAGTQNEYIDIRNNTTGLLRSKITISAPGTESIAVYMPCKKGDEIAAVYTATGTTNRFRFIYAEGENV